VLDAAGAPLGGAKVICFSELAGYRVVFTGKERGEFKVGPLPPATDYSIEVQAQEHAPARVAVKELSPREERDVGAVALQGPAR
jgi:hypothetical protein